MLLERIEIDHHGPLNRVEIGPLSHHLNVVLGPAGSGKTAICRFVRDSLIDREYPRGMLSSSSGRIVWVDQNGWIHCRREQDGTPGGRRTVEFESRGESVPLANGYRDGWFDSAATDSHSDTASHAACHTAAHYRSSLASNALRAIRIPESIVDGVIIDTTANNLSRVIASCVSAGLDREDIARLPFENETSRYSFDRTSEAAADDRCRRDLRSELADVEAELGKLQHVEPVTRWDDDSDLQREREFVARDRDNRLLERERAITRRRTDVLDPLPSGLLSDDTFDDARLRKLHDRAESLRTRAASLQRWIAELDSKPVYQDMPERYSPSRPTYGATYQDGYAIPVAWQTMSVDSLNSQIAQADREILSLRRVLADVRGIREMLASAASFESDWFDRDWMRGRRYGYFVRAMDHYQSDRPWSDFYHRAYQPLHPVDDLSLRIEATQRHLDWLLSRFETLSSDCRHAPQWSWIGDVDRAGNGRGEVIHTIRRAAQQMRHRDFLTSTHMDRIAEELTRTLDHLLVIRTGVVESLGRNHTDWGRRHVAISATHRDSVTHPNWVAERRSAIIELTRVEDELRHVLEQSADLRRSYRVLPVIDPITTFESDRNSETLRVLEIEIHRLDARLRELDATIAERNLEPGRHYRSSPPPTQQIESLHRRRDRLIAELNHDRPVARRESSLAELASRWLVRLSGGRHRVVAWKAGDGRVQATIDRIDERSINASSRSIACVAVRMAAGELLTRMGHAVPLILETNQEWFAGQYNGSPYNDTRVDSYQHWTSEGVTGDVIASALSDYAAAGRQLLILTDHAPLAGGLRRSGARSFELHTQQVVQPHRPLWRSGQRHDQYIGPHGIDVDGMPIVSPVDSVANEFDSQVNRAFDHAWIETAGLREDQPQAPHRPMPVHPGDATDMPRPGTIYRDGYYATSQSSTSSDQAIRQDAESPSMVSDSLISRHGSSTTAPGIAVIHETPFFLTVDSPIDNAPSIDVIAAQRLRRIGISHITHLMNQDSNRLSDTLGLAGVDAKTIRRWQAECRLMCRVRQLRGFDARVLVGCGINDPTKLAAIHPSDLLDRVKTFLSTERGQQILLSGTSYELSRITSWIASANQSVHPGKQRVDSEKRTVNGRHVATRVTREIDSPDRGETYLTDDDFDQDRYEDEVERRADRIADEIDELTRDYDVTGTNRDTTVKRTVSGLKPSLASDSRTRRSSRSTGSAGQRSQARAENRSETRSSRSDRGSRSEPSQRKSSTAQNQKTTLRFYLERSNDVVDAPSIGPRMAERLNRIGIYTVDDMLTTEAESIATKLNHRRIDADTILQWQQQSTLVCRVPMMRGHDAQFLVAADITTVEELSSCKAADLFVKIDAIARSTEGKRIIRGGQAPDLEEVSQWIEHAGQQRSLKAA